MPVQKLLFRHTTSWTYSRAQALNLLIKTISTALHFNAYNCLWIINKEPYYLGYPTVPVSMNSMKSTAVSSSLKIKLFVKFLRRNSQVKNPSYRGLYRPAFTEQYNLQDFVCLFLSLYIFILSSLYSFFLTTLSVLFFCNQRTLQLELIISNLWLQYSFSESSVSSEINSKVMSHLWQQYFFWEKFQRRWT